MLKTERVPLMMEAELVQKIDDYRFAHRLVSRAQAIRELINSGLQEKGAAETAISPRHEIAETLEGNSNDYANR